MKKIKLLFQGDSVTDADRLYVGEGLGRGYVKYATDELVSRFPEVEFEFINLGISGNQTSDLIERLQSDFIDINPDIVSLMIGVNDVWHHSNDGGLPNDIFEERLRTILTAIKEKTHAKLFLIEPFLCPDDGVAHMRADLVSKIEIERKLALEFADSYMPTDGLLYSLFTKESYVGFTDEGIHPTARGAEYLGKLYADYISELI